MAPSAECNLSVCVDDRQTLSHSPQVKPPAWGRVLIIQHTKQRWTRETENKGPSR